MYQDTLHFAQSISLPLSLQQDLLAATSEIARRVLRYGAQRVICTVSASGNALRIEWQAQRGRLVHESSAVQVGPLPARARSRTRPSWIAPTPSLAGAGCRVSRSAGSR